MQIPSHHANSSPFAAFPKNVSEVKTNDATPSSPSASSSPSSTSTATITANDFLQLLVTELQNQDPTANTDPNEYVNQLVQVNSLQQLIQMNQTMDGGPSLTGSSAGLLQQLAQVNENTAATAEVLLQGNQNTGAGSGGGSTSGTGTESNVIQHHAGPGGNLSPNIAPHSNLTAASIRVGRALQP